MLSCRVRKDNIRKFRRRLRWMAKAWARGVITEEKLRQRLASWLGHAGQADSAHLVERLKAQFPDLAKFFGTLPSAATRKAKKGKRVKVAK